tara:strand:+ start:10538 stop:13078 length:2541 start_codon:yes stop_codon:yes gene_type:complete
MSFKDFPNGLNDINEYLDARHHISGTNAAGSENLKIVASAEYSFTLRELLCGMLSGNGLKLPNIQLCMHSNINALLNIPGLQGELKDALNELQSGMESFMDHTKLDEVLGRLNGVLAEAQNVANLINFCATPVDPIAIPNMLERAMGSFLGAGKQLIDNIGSIAPGQTCACISATGGFNASVFNGGILGTIANNFSAINAGNLGQSVIDSIRTDINSVTGSISSLIDFENNISGSYSQGGSQFGTPDSGCNTEMGVLHNPNSGGVAGNARMVAQLKGLYDRLSGYPVQYSLGTGADGHQYDSNGNRILQGEIIEYSNIFQLLLEQSLLDIIARDDDPTPDINNQIPVYDYCGNVIGYTANFEQKTTGKSAGSSPTTPSSPGYNAGGLTTDVSNIAGSSGTTGSTTVINNFNNTGNNLFVVNSEAGMLSINASTDDIVVRTDILTIFTRKDTTTNNTGTVTDFQQATSTLFNFLNNLNVESGSGIVVKDSGVSRARKVVGGTGQISVTNGDGAGGDIQIDLASNPRFPGTAAIKIPAGTTAQRPNTEVGEIRYNTDTHAIEGYFGDVNNWKQLITQTGNTGTLTSSINLGTGQQVFKQLNGSELQFRTLTNTGGIALTSSGTEIQISDSLTSSNVGSGSQVFKQRSTNTFQFRTITSADNSVTVTQGTDTIDLSSDPDVLVSGSTQTTDGTALAVQFNSAYPEPAANKTWFFEMRALGVATSGEKQAFKVEGVVTDSSGTKSIVGTNSKVDYQRSGTADLAQTPWDPMSSYNANDVVEFDLNTYTANNAINATGNNLDPAQDTTNWTVTYTGWNVSAEVIANAFRVRVKGQTGKTVNWKVRITKIEV